MKPTTTVCKSQIASITPAQSVTIIHPVELEPSEIQNSQYLPAVNFQDENFKYQTKSAIYITTRHLDSVFSRPLIQVVASISSMQILVKRNMKFFCIM